MAPHESPARALHCVAAMRSLFRASFSGALLMGALHLHPGAPTAMANGLGEARRLLGELRKSATPPAATAPDLRPDEARIMDEVRPPTLEQAMPGVAVLRTAGVPLLAQ